MQVGDTVFLKDEGSQVTIVAIDGESAMVLKHVGNRDMSLSVELSQLSPDSSVRDKILAKMTPEAAGLVGRNPR